MLSWFLSVATRFSYLASRAGRSPGRPGKSSCRSTNHSFSTSKVPEIPARGRERCQRCVKHPFPPISGHPPRQIRVFVVTVRKTDRRVSCKISPLVHGRNARKICAYPPSTFHTRPRSPRAKKSWPRERWPAGRRRPARFAEITPDSQRSRRAPPRVSHTRPKNAPQKQAKFAWPRRVHSEEPL